MLKVSYPPDQPVYSDALTAQYLKQDVYSHYVGLKALGIICSVILLVFAVACKCKSHYEAEEANRLVLHSLHFCQMVAMFYTVYRSPDGRLYNFLKGFRFSHFSWWFTMFSHTLPTGYVEPYQPATLIPDGNIVRNAGFSFSLWIILVAVAVIALVVVYILYWRNETYPEPPGVRIVLRLLTLFMGLTFMNITFFSVVELVYHDSDGYYPFQGTYTAGFVCSIVMLVLIPLMIAGSYIHNHFTYFSDELEHLYSLRECSQLALNYFQAIVLAVSIDKYYTVCIFAFEILWFGWNILLWSPDHWTDNLKHYVTEAAIVVGYIFLIIGKLTDIATIIIVTLVMVLLIVYCSYQVIGLYYWNVMAIFGIYEEDYVVEGALEIK